MEGLHLEYRERAEKTRLWRLEEEKKYRRRPPDNPGKGPGTATPATPVGDQTKAVTKTPPITPLP
eukprot:13068376-Heterocapsa_arctica.AAC.1